MPPSSRTTTSPPRTPSRLDARLDGVNGGMAALDHMLMAESEGQDWRARLAGGEEQWFRFLLFWRVQTSGEERPDVRGPAGDRIREQSEGGCDLKTDCHSTCIPVLIHTRDTLAAARGVYAHRDITRRPTSDDFGLCIMYGTALYGLCCKPTRTG